MIDCLLCYGFLSNSVYLGQWLGCCGTEKGFATDSERASVVKGFKLTIESQMQYSTSDLMERAYNFFKVYIFKI